MKCNKVFGRLFLVALCLCHVANVFAQDNVIDRVEWVVGDKAILRSDIESAIDFWVENDRRFDGLLLL